MIALLIQLVSIYVFQLVNCRETDDSKIVGGSFVDDIKKMPWIINIEVTDMGHVCGGSILTPVIVLTACHCLVIEVSNEKSVPSTLSDVEDFRFKAGSVMPRDYKDQQVQSRNASFFLVHPKCRDDNHIQVYDYGVAVMVSSFKINEFVKPINILSMDGKEFEKKLDKLLNDPKTFCYVAGWGEVRRGSLQADDPGLMSKKLKMIRMYILPEKKCRNVYVRKDERFGNFSFKEHHQICGVSNTGWGSDCQGDSGGPFVCDNFQVALVSYGFECGISTPATYAGLGLFIEWFNKAVLREVSQRLASSATRIWMPHSALYKYIIFSLLLGFRDW